MAVDTLSSFPASIMAGTTLRLCLAGGSYPASTWTGYLGIVGEGQDRRATWTADGDDHLFVFSSDDTASLPPGNYRYQFVAEEQSSNERAAVCGDDFVVTRDLISATPYVSDNQKMLTALIEFQTGRMDAGAAESFSIEGQSITHMSMLDMDSLINKLKRRVKMEHARERRRTTGKDSLTVNTTLI